MSEASTLDVRQFIDDQPFSRYQFMVVGLCVLAVVMEGFDAQAMGYVAPVVSRELHITRAALGPVLSSGLVGMMIGALALGPFGDRVGRKSILLFSILLVGMASLLTATATSLDSLLVFRLLTGLGLGGSLPNLVALNSEYTPQPLRATAIVIAGCGFSIGATIGGFASAGLLEWSGWRSVFVVGGILPCAVAVVLFRWLPESIRFLVEKGGEEQKVRRALSRIAPGVSISPAMVFLAGERRVNGFTVKQLFTGGRAGLTLVIWVIFFMSLLDVYFLNNWLPTVMHDTGIALHKAITITAMFQAGGTIGALTLGRLIDRFSSFRVLAWAYLAGGVCVFVIGAVGASVVLITCAVFGAGFCVVGGQIGANALAAEAYPTSVRSTGVGWALGIGRIGSIAGPLLGNMLLSSTGGVRHVFSAAALPVLVAGIAGFFAGNSPSLSVRTTGADGHTRIATALE